MKYNQQLSYLIILLITMCSFNGFNSNKHRNTFRSKNKNHHRAKLNIKEKAKKLREITDFSHARIIFQGWGHYYHELNKPIMKPKSLFQNNEFFNQRTRMAEKDKSDENGKLNIPDRSSFYIVVFKNVVSIFSARNKIERKNIDNLMIKNIAPIPEDDIKLGGVEELGKQQDYYCIRIRTRLNSKFVDSENNTEEPEKDRENWVICFDLEVKERKFLSAIVNLKIKEQRDRDYFITAEQLPDEDKAHLAKNNKQDMENRKLKSVDGKLQLLQDWSECTLKCGGGKSYQHWMCIPPKNGGEPCKGKLIRSRDCNIQPCPLNNFLEDEKLEGEEYRKPIVKIGPYSKRHNRYTKCLIKEGDAFRIEIDPETKERTKIPSKIMMNNRTLSIYEDDSFEKLVYAFPLAKTDFTPIKKEFCVFELKDFERKIELRGFDSSCGTPEEDFFVKSWEKEFEMFKHECKTGRQDVLLDKDSQKRIDDMAKKRRELMNFQKQADKAANLSSEFSAGLQSQIATGLHDTQQNALKVINKEEVIENMILNEEKEKETMELTKIQKQIDREKMKANAMSQTIQEKEIDDLFRQTEREAEEDITEEKEAAKQKIKEKRNALQKKIQSLRKMALIKKSQMMNKLKKAKTTLARKVMNSLKTGDSEVCQKGKVEEAASVRENYCNSRFPDDYLLNLECKDIENFCYSCCEKEFGNMHLDKREDCYNECDGISPQGVAMQQNETKKLKWVWQATKKEDK